MCQVEWIDKLHALPAVLIVNATVTTVKSEFSITLHHIHKATTSNITKNATV